MFSLSCLNPPGQSFCKAFIQLSSLLENDFFDLWFRYFIDLIHHAASSLLVRHKIMAAEFYTLKNTRTNQINVGRLYKRTALFDPC